MHSLGAAWGMGGGVRDGVEFDTAGREGVDIAGLPGGQEVGEGAVEASLGEERKGIVQPEELPWMDPGKGEGLAQACSGGADGTEVGGKCDALDNFLFLVEFADAGFEAGGVGQGGWERL